MTTASMQDMTQGPIRPHLLRIAGFVCVSMLMQTLYALVDLFWVGRLGHEALAAVSIASNLQFLALAGTQTLGVGTVALISQAAGHKDMAAVTFNTAQATALSLAGCLLFLLLGFAGMRFYAETLSADVLTAQLTMDYLFWFLPSLGLQFLMTAQICALRGIGNMNLALVAQSGSVLLNIVLAPMLIFGWPFHLPMGVAGAGLATFISVLAATLWLSLKLSRSKGPLRFPLAQLRPQFALWRRLLLIGLPAGGEFLLMTIYLLLIYAITRDFGPDAQAGFGVGMRWLQTFFIPALAISFAAAAVAGQNFGARQFERVRATFREALLQAGLLMLLAMLLLQIAPGWLVGLFSDVPGVITTGAEFLRIISWNLLASALIFACGGLFQGMGNTIPSLISSAVRISLIVGLALWLSERPGFHLWQIWVLSVITTVLQAVLSALFLRREFRLRLGPAPTPAALLAEVRPTPG